MKFKSILFAACALALSSGAASAQTQTAPVPQCQNPPSSVQGGTPSSCGYILGYIDGTGHFQQIDSTHPLPTQSGGSSTTAVTVANGADVTQGTINDTHTQGTVVGFLKDMWTALTTGPVPVSATSLPLPAGASISALQPALNGDGGALAHVTNFPATQPISAAALPLPTGAMGSNGGTVQLVPQTRASYRIIATAYSGYATPTDLFCLPGSPTKTVYISGFAMTAAATAATLETVSFIKRTTANTGGTASQPTITLLDSAEGSATTAGNLYSVIPTGLGTSGGLIGLVTAATGTLTAAPALYSVAGQIIIPNTGTVGLPITLRGTSEQACINWGGAALPSGFTGTIYIEWQEQ